MIDYTAVLDLYSLEDILEQNDITPEECLEYLVDCKYVTLPDVEPLDFE